MVWQHFAHCTLHMLCFVSYTAQVQHIAHIPCFARYFALFTLQYTAYSMLLSVFCTAYITGPGLHNLFHPTIRDGSTWSKFGARGEHGDVLLFFNLGAL